MTDAVDTINCNSVISTTGNGGDIFFPIIKSREILFLYNLDLILRFGS